MLWLTMMPMEMVSLTHKMKWTKNITKNGLNGVTITMTEPLICVKFTLVSSTSKMNGELNTAQKDIHKSIVIAHSMLLNVKENGLVMISMKSQLKLWPIMILMMMVLFLLKMILNLPT